MQDAIETPRLGRAFPDFDLLTTDGKRVRRADFIGRRPLLVTFASLTCAMTAAAAKKLARLHSRYGQDVDFLTVYVREARPGAVVPQAADLDEKLNYAHQLQRRDEVAWPVAVDTLEGDFHLELGAEPNGCYVMDRDGLVAFHAAWSGDEAAIDQALDAVARGASPRIRESLAQPSGRGLTTAVLLGLGGLAVVAAMAASTSSRRC